MIRVAYLAWLRSHLQRMLRDTRRAREIQQRVLIGKLARNADSEFGRVHAFSDIRSVSEFRSRVPVLTYEDLSPYLLRVLNGETTALFAPGTRVRMFAMTSGTTAEPKRLPITSDVLSEYTKSWRLWAAGAFGDHRDLLWKKTLQLASDWQQFRSPTGVPCGQISGLAATTRPQIAAWMFLPPLSTMEIHDPEARHYTTLRIALAHHRIGMIVTANPCTLIDFALRMRNNCDSLLRDLHDGTISCEVPPHVKAALGPHFSRRRRRRARTLELLASRYGELLPSLVWPDLSMLAVWTGGAAGMFLPRLAEFYGPVAVRDHGLSASEGRMTIPLADGISAGLLDYYHSYFEFIPVEEYGRPSPNVLEAHELIEGREYYILLTTSGGLYRYDIHDVVRCEGYRGQAPLLKFLNKGEFFSNLTGEKLSEFQIVVAVEKSFRELGLPIGLFMVAPVIQAEVGYVLMLEPRFDVGRRADIAAFVQANLEQVNEEYASKCRSGRLAPLQVREVPTGTWRKMRDRKIQTCGSLEQYKHPFLAQDVTLVDQLTANADERNPSHIMLTNRTGVRSASATLQPI